MSEQLSKISMLDLRPAQEPSMRMVHQKPLPESELSEPVVNQEPTHQGVEKLMHPGEWHPLHAFKIRLDAKKAARGRR